MAADAQRSHMEGKTPACVASADVVLEVDGRRFLAHTQLLSSESPVLAELLAEYAGAGRKGGELPVVTLAKREDADALGARPDWLGDMFALLAARPDRRGDTFAALLDAVYNPAKRMAASWYLWELESLASMAHVLQMDSLLILVDEVAARELAKLFESSVSSWATSHGKRGGVRCYASAIGRTDTKWCLLGERCGLPKTTAVALRSALKKVTGAERQEGVDARVVREFVQQFGAEIQCVILDEMIAAVYPPGPHGAPGVPLADKLRDAMGLGARQKPSRA